jgi:hypothetical protein
MACPGYGCASVTSGATNEIAEVGAEGHQAAILGEESHILADDHGLVGEGL